MRDARALFSLLAVLALAACGGGGGASSDPGGNRAPSLSALHLSPATVPVPAAGERFTLTLAFDFDDPDGDLTNIDISYSDPTGRLVSGSESFRPLNLTGTAEQDFAVDSSYPAGNYEVGIEIIDDNGNRSGYLSTQFTVSPSASPPLSITGLSSNSGVPGDVLSVYGTGFESQDSEANRLFFGNSLIRASVVSAMPNTLEIIIPDNAYSGPVVLETPMGRSLSPGTFTVHGNVSITTGIGQLILDKTVELICVESGISSQGIEWSIIGQSGALLGAIDQSGSYTAPSTLPPANPVTVRCQSVADPSLYADLDIMILQPIAPAGTGTVTAGEGGRVESADSRIILSIPPGSVSSNTLFQVFNLDPASLPPASDDHINLAAAEFDTLAGTLSQAADVTFTLLKWIEPGTLLPVYLLDGSGNSLTDTGIFATVDTTGLAATFQVNHFSTYVIAMQLSANYRQSMSDIMTRHIPVFGQFTITTPVEIPKLEGMSIPLLIQYNLGDGQGPGPFLPGVQVTPVLAGTTRETTPLTTEFVQASATGWGLGAVIHIPTLPACGEGDTADVTLYLDYPVPHGSGSTTSMQFDLTIDCLDELIFDAGTPPDPIPAGATQIFVNGVRTLGFEPGNSYRFSKMHIGPGSSIWVNRYWDPANAVTPLSFLVTGDVTVEGSIFAYGSDGENGGNGSGSDNGGAGGDHGAIGAGRGGTGGPSSTSTADRDGRNTLFQPYGGKGGQHGYKWDAASWVSVVIAGAKIWYDTFQVATAPADLMAWYDLVVDFYEGTQTTIKYNKSEQNQILSAGFGGTAGSRLWTQYWQGLYPIPRPGGGGGGSGKMRIDGEPDAAGAGGGGGGGAAQNIFITSGGRVLFTENAVYDSSGGNGGWGGNGSRHSWSNQAAPGAGGAGGSGGYLGIVTRLGLINNGRMSAPGGKGSLGGEINDDGDVILLPRTFGEPGQQGILVLKGRLTGSTPKFTNVTFPYFDASAHSLPFSVNSSYQSAVGSGNHAGVDLFVNGVKTGSWNGGGTTATFPLEPGLNTLSMMPSQWHFVGVGEPGAMHPWTKHFVFYFPNLRDWDGDGLADGMENHIATDPANPDSDGDGLTDGEELLDHQTDPLNADTDGDGYTDSNEIYNGTDPNDPADHPGIDSDGDGLPDGWEILHFGNLTQPGVGDFEGDGLSNSEEHFAGTDPKVSDTDGDGAFDGIEIQQGSDPLSAASTPEVCDGIDNDQDGGVDEGFPNTDGDSMMDCVDPDDDNDNLTDTQEATLGTDPLDPDSDNDRLNDGQEVNYLGTDPLDPDTDNDGLTDGREVLDIGSYPLNPDSDGDTLTDGMEVDTYGTDPLSSDTDGEGLLDNDEIFTHGTDPLKPDTDDDGYSDFQEIDLGTDPLNPASYPGGDADGDGMADDWEILHFGNINQNGGSDSDLDLLTNLEEYQLNTNPVLQDTDSDGFWDGVEQDLGSDPLVAGSIPEVCDGTDNDLDSAVDEGVCQVRSDSKGTEFLLAFMPAQSGSNPDVKLVITAELTAQVTVEYPVISPTYIRTFSVSYGQPYVLSDIPRSAATSWVAGTPTNNALRVRADNEVSVVMANYQFTIADQALALPVDVLNRDYVVMSRAPGQNYGSQYIVVATQDNTTLTLNGTGTVNLNRGEGYLGTGNLQAQITGVTLQADKPVAMFNGNKCASVPDNTNYCEHLFEQAVPVSLWSTDYLARNLPDGAGSPRRTYYRILAAQDNTSISRNGTSIGTLNVGNYIELAAEAGDLASHFTADQPIFVTQYMNSLCDENPSAPACSDPNAGVALDDLGDASMTNLVGTGEFPTMYQFFNPREYFYFDTSFLNIVAHTNDATNSRVLLDGIPVDPSLFSPFADRTDLSHAVVPLSWGSHTSRSPSGHALWVVVMGERSAMTSPFGTLLTPIPPQPPSGLGVARTSQTTLTLTWQDNSNNEDGFRIYRGAAANQVSTLIGTVGPGITGYPDSGLSPSTTYYYAVRAFNSAGVSAPSSVASNTTHADINGSWYLYYTVTTDNCSFTPPDISSPVNITDNNNQVSMNTPYGTLAGRRSGDVVSLSGTLNVNSYPLIVNVNTLAISPDGQSMNGVAQWTINRSWPYTDCRGSATMDLTR